MNTIDIESPMFEKMLNWNIRNNGGTTYTIASQEEGKDPFLTEYRSRPCNGEMRMYAKTHPDIVKDGVTMPSDLSIRFPDGNPIAIGLAGLAGSADERTFTEWTINGEDSPFRNSFPKGSIHLDYDKRGGINSVIFLDTKIDPTVTLYWIINRRRWKHRDFVDLAGKYGPLVAYIMQTVAWKGYGGAGWGSYDGYTTSSRSDLKRLVQASPLKLSHNADTFYDRGVYNRPQLHHIWHVDDSKQAKPSDIHEFLRKSDTTGRNEIPEQVVADYIINAIKEVK